MYRLAALAMPIIKPGYSLRFVKLPSGMDPDDFLKQANGAQRMSELLADATKLADVIFSWQYQLKPRNSPESRAEFEQSLFKSLEQFQDKSIAAQYRRYFVEKLNEFNRLKFKASKSMQTKKLVSTTLNQKEELMPQEREIFYFVLQNLQILKDEEIEEEFTLFEFSNDNAKQMQQIILDNLEVSDSEQMQAIIKKQLLLQGFIASLANRITKKNMHQDLKMTWKKLTNLYCLAKMQQDYEKLWLSDDQNSQQQAIALKNDITNLHRRINEI